MCMNKKRLCLVEDNPDDEALSLRGVAAASTPCEVNVYRHGVEAIDGLLDDNAPIPDLILLDYNLPGANALEVLKQVRSNGRTSKVPIVVFSSSVEDTTVCRCYREGASSCILKPMDFKSYVEQVALIVRYWLSASLPCEPAFDACEGLDGAAPLTDVPDGHLKTKGKKDD